MALDQLQAKVQALYIGYFGRAGEPAGVSYWLGQLESGTPWESVAAAFMLQPEAKAEYAFLDDPANGNAAAFIAAIYRNVFGREPDAAGAQYWIEQFEAMDGRPDAIGRLILDIISGAYGEQGSAADIACIENKIEAASHFMALLQAAGIAGNHIDEHGRAVLDANLIDASRASVSAVTSDFASVETALRSIDAFVREIVNPALGDEDGNAPGGLFEETDESTEPGSVDGNVEPGAQDSGDGDEEDEEENENEVGIGGGGSDEEEGEDEDEDEVVIGGDGSDEEEDGGGDGEGKEGEGKEGEGEGDGAGTGGGDEEEDEHENKTEKGDDDNGHNDSGAQSGFDERTLTPGVDEILWVDRPLRIEAVLGGDAPTLNEGDSIDGDGGSGSEINIHAHGKNLLPAGAIRNIDIVNFMNAADVSGAIETEYIENYRELWQSGHAVDVHGVGNSEIVGFRDVDASNATVAFSGGFANIRFDNATSGAANQPGAGLTIAGPYVSELNVTGSLRSASENDLAVLKLQFDQTLERISKLSLFLAGATSIDLAGPGVAKIEEIDASGSDEGIQTSLAGSDLALRKILTGIGDDSIEVAAKVVRSGLLQIDAGGGDDVITLDYSNGEQGNNLMIWVTLGEGADTLKIVKGGNLLSDDEGDIEDNLITVLDFRPDESDRIDLSDFGFTGFFDQATINAVVDTLKGCGLKDILTAVAEKIGQRAAAQFSFEGATFVFINDDERELGSGDTLIKLAGVHELLAEGDVVFRTV